MIGRAAAVWLLLLVIAVAAGGLRSALVEPRWGEATAHVAGSLVVVTLFAAVIGRTVRWIDPRLEPRSLWRLGASWLVATIVFEFLFGHWVAGHSWARLVADYDLTAGRIWSLVLVTILVAPAVSGAVLRR